MTQEQKNNIIEEIKRQISVGRLIWEGNINDYIFDVILIRLASDLGYSFDELIDVWNEYILSVNPNAKYRDERK